MNSPVSPQSLETPSLLARSPRYDYLDNLRAFALLLGIFFHTAIAYSLYMNEFWITADTQKSSILEGMAFFTHLFRMPLFMLIAGFFGCYLLQKYELKGFIRNRNIRILAPFLLFFPIIMGFYVGIFIYGVKHVEHKSPLLTLVSTFATNPSARLNMPMGTGHFWFLYNLILFYVVAVILVKLKPFKLTSKIANLSEKSAKALSLIGLPLIITPSFYSMHFPPIDMPDKFYPQLWSFGYYGVYFATGWIMFSNQQLITLVENYWKFLVGFATFAFIGMYQLYPKTTTLAAIIDPKGYIITNPLLHLGYSFMHSLISAYMVLGLLVFGKKYLDVKNSILMYLSQSSYWVYLIHLPIIMFIQLKLLDTNWPLWCKFLVTLPLATIISLASYQIFVRHTPIGWLLNGRKKKQYPKKIAP